MTEQRGFPGHVANVDPHHGNAARWPIQSATSLRSIPPHPATRCLLCRFNQHTSPGKISFKAMTAFFPQLRRMCNVRRRYLTDHILLLLLIRSFSSWFNLCVISLPLNFQFCLICRCLNRCTLHQTELNRICLLVAPATIAGSLSNKIEQKKVLDIFMFQCHSSQGLCLFT